MPIYRDYFIFIALLGLSFLILLLFKTKTNNKPLSNSKGVLITLGIVVFYIIIKKLFGWKFSNWYFEAFLLLCTFSTLDYYVIIRNRYSPRTQIIYYYLRILSFMTPIAVFGLSLFITLLTLGFGYDVMCYARPIVRNEGEQWVYKNLYMYQNRCGLSHNLVFKKKFLFFEKDVFNAGSSFLPSFGWTPDNQHTGYITKDHDSIFITNQTQLRKFRSSQGSKNYIKITILKPNHIRIDCISQNAKSVGLNEELNVYKTEEIKL